jgi:hypothetical protein
MASSSFHFTQTHLGPARWQFSFECFDLGRAGFCRVGSPVVDRAWLNTCPDTLAPPLIWLARPSLRCVMACRGTSSKQSLIFIAVASGTTS